MRDAIPIDTASLEDAASIADIYAHYVVNSTATFETEPPDSAEIAARMRKIFDGGYPWLVARDENGAVMGYAYASSFHPRQGYKYSCETSIYVHPDAKGRGIGTALLGGLLEDCKARGLRQVFAIIAGTEPASVVLHARHGFRPCGTLENAGRKHGKWIDVFLMQRALGQGGDTPPATEPN